MTTQAAQTTSILGAAPVMNVAGATDAFPAQAGSTYLLWIVNASGSSVAAVIADSTSVAPALATAFTPSVTVTVPAGTTRQLKINADRFRDSSGNVNIAFTPNASVTYAIIGPL